MFKLAPHDPAIGPARNIQRTLAVLLIQARPLTVIVVPRSQPEPVCETQPLEDEIRTLKKQGRDKDRRIAELEETVRQMDLAISFHRGRAARTQRGVDFQFTEDKS